MEWLKKLLGDDLYSKVVEKLGDKKIIEDDGKLIPKHRFDEVNNKKTELETALQTAKDATIKVQTEFDTFKKDKDGGKKTLEQQIQTLIDKQTTLENSLKEKDQQLVVRDKRSVVEKQLRELGANEKYLSTLLREFEAKNPLDKVEIVEGKIKDAETIFKPFQEGYKDLFGEVQKVGGSPAPGSGSGETDYSKLSDAEYFSKRITEQNKK